MAAIVHFNVPVVLSSSTEKVWTVQDGTRKVLTIINKLDMNGVYGRHGEVDTTIKVRTLRDIRIGTLKKGNHGFIFLNEPVDNKFNIETRSRILGVFLSDYSEYTAVDGPLPVFELGSSSKYRQFKFGVYELGTGIKLNNCNYKLTADGWQHWS